MSEKRSVIAYGYWKETSEKFDYYVTGLTGALCVYIGQTLQPQRISFSPNTLELLALLILVLSVFAGFKRIEKALLMYLYNHRYLHLNEKIGGLKLGLSNSQFAINEESGEVWNRESATEEIRRSANQLRELQPLMKAAQDATLYWYKLRNRLLFLGFPVLLIARILTAYYK